MAKDTDSISSGSDDSGAHVKNMDEKIKTQTQTMTTTATTTTTSKSVEMSNVVKTSNTSTSTMIKKPPRKSRLPEPVTHFSQPASLRHSYSGKSHLDENEDLSQEESFHSPTRRYKKNSEIVQVSLHHFLGGEERKKSYNRIKQNGWSVMQPRWNVLDDRAWSALTWSFVFTWSSLGSCGDEGSNWPKW